MERRRLPLRKRWRKMALEVASMMARMRVGRSNTRHARAIGAIVAEKIDQGNEFYSK